MTYQTETTMNELLDIDGGNHDWSKMLAWVDLNLTDDAPLDIATVLEISGFIHAVYALKAPSLGRLSRHYQAAIAERVLHLFEAQHPGDTRVRDQIAVLRNDDATRWMRAATQAAARDAANPVSSLLGPKFGDDVAADFAAHAAADFCPMFASQFAVMAVAFSTPWPSARRLGVASHKERAAQEQILRKMIGAEK